jgi:subtilisin family serine protease
MRRFAVAALLAFAMTVGALGSASAQLPPPRGVGGGVRIGHGTITTRGITITTRGTATTPLGWYVMGSAACAAVAPMIGTVVLGREMTLSEVYHSTFGCVLGPVGWLLADWLVPPGTDMPGRPGTPGRAPRGRAPQQGNQARGRNITIPPPGVTDYVVDEMLTETAPGTSDQQIGGMAAALQLTRLETQSFALTGRTLQRWRIGGGGTVRATLQAVRQRFAFVIAAQPEWLYRSVQSQPAAPAPAAPPQYVVSKLHLTEAHRITGGDGVLVAVIDSRIDTHHPDLAGAVADEYDALGTQGPPHAHGTAMAGAIAAHGKLTGVAPKVRLLAVRAFAGEGASAQGTTFNVLKGLDWAAGRNARIVNMSFAGPPDAMLREMLAKAYQRGMVLIAAVGNAGARSPPLYPAADPHVIGVTAIDADDKLLQLANRGRQVTFAAPGVNVIADAPDDNYQLTTGTSVAAALASGVAALVLARDPRLSPAAVRQIMVRSARHIAGKRDDIGAGEVDALAAVEGIGKLAR